MRYNVAAVSEGRYRESLDSSACRIVRRCLAAPPVAFTRGTRMRCSHCGSENADERRFCTECGTALLTLCKCCGAHNPLNAKFCGACGKALPSRMQSDTERPHTPLPELRQATVLFADLCGFTHLSHQLDLEATHGLLGRFFEAVDEVVMRYGGNIEKHPGDA